MAWSLENHFLKEAEVLIRLNKEIELKHQLLLDNMCDKMKIASENFKQTFHKIAHELFHDNMNLGRLVVLCTSTAKLALYSNCIKISDEVVVWLGDFLAKQHLWIEKKVLVGLDS